jgi:hypothetical protein
MTALFVVTVCPPTTAVPPVPRITGITAPFVTAIVDGTITLILVVTGTVAAPPVVKVPAVVEVVMVVVIVLAPAPEVNVLPAPAPVEA